MRSVDQSKLFRSNQKAWTSNVLRSSDMEIGFSAKNALPHALWTCMAKDVRLDKPKRAMTT